MKTINKTIISIILSVVLCISQNIMVLNSNAQNTSEAADKYDYLFTNSSESAFAITGNDIETSGCNIIKPTDKDDLRYYTLTTEEGINSAYFGGAHYLGVKFNDSFYSLDEHEFLFSIVYYDYGPNKGTFYFSYYNTGGVLQTVPLIKPAKIKGWAVNTVILDDVDLSKSFEDGAHIRIECSSGGKNAFKKVEAVNISKAKREGKKIDISCIGTQLTFNLEELEFIERTDETYIGKNIGMPCTQYDVQKLILNIEGKDSSQLSENLKTQTLTQGELVKIFLNALGLSYDEDILKSGYNHGLLSLSDFILNADSTATMFNLVNLAYSAIYFKKADGTSFISKLISEGHFKQDTIDNITDEKFIELYYLTPQKLPYTRIVDPETGRTYYYINFFGKEMRRPYMTLQCWSEDGKGMIVSRGGTASQNLFYYNIEEQMLYFIDSQVSTYGEGVNAIFGTDNKIYYLKIVGQQKEIRCANITDFKTELLYTVPKNVTIGGFSASNDCRYLAFDYREPYTPDKNYPEGSNLGVRIDLKTGKWDIFHHNWEIKNKMNHVQINPVYTDLLFFCHEGSGATGVGVIDDRIWTIDLSTGEKKNAFKQGMALGESLVVPTHETWTTDGEWLSFVHATNRTGGLFMVDKYGRHVRKFANPYGYFYKHCYTSGDGKYLVADGHYMTVISTETEQVYKISRWKEDGNGGQVNHPYHPHPIVARNQYKASWGMVYENVLGVAWYDFTEIAENETAKGDHYTLNETVDRISYEGLDCETKEVNKSGEDCLYVKRGNSLYLDINPAVVDSVNGAVTVSFDYLDDSFIPLVLTYTRGILKDNDYANIDNGKVTINRNKSRQWKTATINIECGNFENPGKYASDIKISGVSADLYIKNIRVEAKENN